MWFEETAPNSRPPWMAVRDSVSVSRAECMQPSDGHDKTWSDNQRSERTGRLAVRCARSVSGPIMLSLTALAVLGWTVALAQSDVEWPMHGGPDNTRYSPLVQINRDNVAKLRVAWTYDSHDAFKGSEMQSNPVVGDAVLYPTPPTLKLM